MNIDEFCIDINYKIRENIKFKDATDRTDEFQDKVYKYAKLVFINFNLKDVIDLGCGSAYKLKKYFPDTNVSGYELEPTVSWLKNKYPHDKWYLSDFDSNPINADLVICADVIEHVLNPTDLIQYIKKMKPKHIVISTPDRQLMVDKQKRSYLGPPHNKHHVREWTFLEFNNYISKYFDIIHHFNIEKECSQCLHCK